MSLSAANEFARQGSEPKHAPKATGMTDCWVWQGAKTSSGYPSVRWANGTRGAHTVALELKLDKKLNTAKGEQCGHKCGNKHCVRPSHLEVCSQAENEARKGNYG